MPDPVVDCSIPNQLQLQIVKNPRFGVRRKKINVNLKGRDRSVRSTDAKMPGILSNPGHIVL
jgi:hypothetical protein